MTTDRSMGGPAAPPLTPWEPPAPEPRRRGIGFALVAVVAVLALGAGGLVALRITSGEDHPGKWDDRIEPLVEFVEEERGLEFDHAVQVEFLDEKAFAVETTSDRSDLDEEQEKEIEQDLALLRALGLAEGDLDLFDARNRLSAETILAFYRFSDEHIVVRGTELGVSTRVTLVHELTHALQDQHFGIGDSMSDESTYTLAFQALVEGDATTVSNAYLENLDEQDREEYTATQQDFMDGMDLEGIPEVFTVLQSAPYAAGPPLVTTLLERGGRSRLDAAFEDPPVTDEHLLSPITYLDGEKAVDVPEPVLSSGEHMIDGDEPEEFGALGWFAVLSERIDAHDALHAVDGWGGDSTVSFERDGTSCGRAVLRGDTPIDTTHLYTAFHDWRDEMPDGAATVETDGQLVTVTSCDPGADVKMVTGHAADALVLPLIRPVLFAQLLGEGLPLDGAWCVAEGFVDQSGVKELADTDPSREAIDEITRRMTSVATSCRARQG